MIGNYFRIMLRQLWRNKTYFTINLIGLTAAITCVILSVSFLFNQLSYDKFHKNGNSIYRLAKKNVSTTSGAESYDAETSGMMGPTMVNQFPEVINVIRVQPWWDDVLVSYKEKSFKVSPWVFADSAFFNVFDFELTRGDKSTVLTRPLSIVLTEGLAKKLFGDQDPIGNSIVGMNNLDFIVTGIAADPPKNSHIRFEALVSWSTTVPGTGPLAYDFMNNWLGQTIYTYLLLEENVDANRLQSKFPDFMKRNFPERAENYLLFLQPLDDVFLHSYNFLYSRFPMGSIRLLSVFLAITAAVLLIACFNYINISTAKATQRASEIGVRKVLGANRRQLVTQFLGESYMLIFLSLSLSFLLADISLPTFNELVGTQLTMSGLFSIEVISSLGIIILIVGLMAGLYPAFLLSGLQSTGMLRPSSRITSGAKARHLLTLIQFMVSIALITVSLIIIDQYDFMRNHELGFESEKVLVIPTDNSISNSHETFRNELLKNPDILQVSICQAAIGTGTFGSTVIPVGMTEEMSTQIFRVDKNFLDTYQIPLIDGRWFNSELDTGFSIVINETFAKQAGWNNLNEMAIQDTDGPVPVIGVVKDFNYRPLNEVKVDPVLMLIVNRNFNNASVRISGNNIQPTLQYLEQTFLKFETRHPFEFYFVDQWFDGQYKAQDKFMKIMSLFTALSIILACLGLYGLTSFTLSSRLKEIGIRKVLGASVTSILVTVNTRFFILLILAILVASPVAFYFGQRWLADFPYRIEIGFSVFMISAISALLISGITVSIQSLMAANTNPAAVLKQE
ncbi:MAG TPA: ABC transporter permease [Cyclobacteriaceae bacterium]